MYKKIIRRSLYIPPRPWLHLPVETKVREWDGKMLLALEAAAQGWGVIIGRGIRKKSYLPSGVFIENSISPGRKKDIDYSVSRGRKVCAWCEEGVVYFDAQDYERRRVEKKSYDALEYYFSWGQHLANDMIGPIGCDPAKMAITGNPRFDILRADRRDILKNRTHSITQKYGDFILINTKFARYNNYFGQEGFIEKLKEGRKVNNAEQESFERGLIEFQGHIFHKFMEAIPSIVKSFPDRAIVIRPHPAENIDPWITLASQYKNVYVENTGNVADWLMACSLCVHSNCTTAIESFLLGKISISYNPYDDLKYDTHLPRALSYNVRTLDELIYAIGNYRHVGIATKEQMAIAEEYISGQNGPTASQEIMRHLNTIDLKPEPGSFNEITLLGRLVKRILEYLRSIKCRFLKQKETANSRYTKQKFDRVNKCEVEAFLKDIQTATGLYNDIKIYEIDPSCFCITR